jgi:transposase
MGSSYEITEAHLEEVEEAAAQGCSQEQCAAVIGLGRATWHRRVKEAEEGSPASRLKEVWRRGRSVAVRAVENAAFECALKAKDDPRYQTSMIFWLKTQAEWSASEEHDIRIRTDTESRDELAGAIRQLASGEEA